MQVRIEFRTQLFWPKFREPPWNQLTASTVRKVTEPAWNADRGAGPPVPVPGRDLSASRRRRREGMDSSTTQGSIGNVLVRNGFRERRCGRSRTPGRSRRLTGRGSRRKTLPPRRVPFQRQKAVSTPIMNYWAAQWDEPIPPAGKYLDQAGA
jgi:hypothetical protein